MGEIDEMQRAQAEQRREANEMQLQETARANCGRKGTFSSPNTMASCDYCV